jgi:hypothetical protein
MPKAANAAARALVAVRRDQEAADAIRYEQSSTELALVCVFRSVDFAQHLFQRMGDNCCGAQDDPCCRRRPVASREKTVNKEACLPDGSPSSVHTSITNTHAGASTMAVSDQAARGALPRPQRPLQDHPFSAPPRVFPLQWMRLVTPRGVGRGCSCRTWLQACRTNMVGQRLETRG